MDFHCYLYCLLLFIKLFYLFLLFIFIKLLHLYYYIIHIDILLFISKENEYIFTMYMIHSQN